MPVKTSLSFGLVYIPVTLNKKVKENDIGFNLIDKKTMSRVQYKKSCVDCGDRIVKQEDIVKGFEYEKDKYVIFEDEDFEKIKSKKDKSIVIESFVDLSEIDPVYFDTPYTVVPTGAEKAFGVLVKAMEQENKAGIAKTVLTSRDTLVAVRVREGEMILNTLFFADEVKSGQVFSGETGEKELELAKTIIKSMTEKFRPEKYKDEYREKVLEAIEKKIAGKRIEPVKEKKANNVIDLMEALQKSLKEVKKPAKKKA